MEVKRVSSGPSAPSPEESTTAASGLRKFGSHLHTTLVQRNERENFVFSPYSISCAISLAHLGAAGSTRNRIDSVMGYGGLNPVRMASSLEWLGLAGAGRDKLSMANAAWMQEGYKFLESFSGDLVEIGSEIRSLDFRGNREKASRVINAWVEQHTKGKIKDLIPPHAIDSLTRLILTNAVHFKDQWEKAFDEERTSDDVFRGAGGNSEVKMMRGFNIEGRYVKRRGYEAVLLPYSSSAGMLVILPEEADRPDHAVIGFEAREMDPYGQFLVDIFSEARRAKITMEMPKFGVESSFSMKDALCEIGLGEIFEDGVADFSGMTGGKDLFVSAVVHKAMIDVNERDTEAAAATGMVMKRCSAALNELRVTVRVDRPFFFAIVSPYHKAPFFMGRILDL